MKKLLLIVAILMNVYGLYGQVKTILYTADSTGIFPNPERGFAPVIDPPWAPEIKWDFCGCTGYDWEEWTNPLNAGDLEKWRREGYSLVMIRYHIAEFRNDSISEEFLDRLGRDFNLARAKGFKLIPRFTYNWPMGGPDAPLEKVLLHFSQLGPVLNEHKDVLNNLEFGFIGCWGEMHSSCYGLQEGAMPNENSFILIDSLFNSVPVERMIALRYPRWMFLYFNDDLRPQDPLAEEEAYSGSLKARWAHHDDCITCGEWNCGTWWSPRNNAQEIMDYLEQGNRYVFQGGEPGDPETPGCTLNGDVDKDGWGNNQHADCDRMLWQLKKARWSSMNVSYGMNFNNVASQIWKEQGCYQEIARKLGYRYRLVSAEIPGRAAPGKAMHMRLEIVNDGWSAAHNPRGVEIIFRNQQSGLETAFIIHDGFSIPEDHTKDPRFWQSGEPVILDLDIDIPASFTEGDSYELFLHLPDPLLHGRPEYNIRLANIGTWRSGKGYNALLHTLEIDHTAGVTGYQNDQFNLGPNPAGDQLLFSGLSPGKHILKFYSSNGSLVKTSLQSEASFTENISGFSNGLYLVHFSTPSQNQESWHKIVVNMNK